MDVIQARETGRPGYGGWPWLPFVDLSLAMALLPGFLMGAGLVYVLMAGGPAQDWFAPAVQAHGHAQLLGWGGAMILGVLLYFLPRLAGAPLASADRVPVWFWLFAGGMGLRVVGQSVGPLLPAATVWGPWLLVIGTAMELAGVGGILAALVRTARQGSKIQASGIFAQVGPFLLAAGVALVAALGFLLVGAGAAPTVEGLTVPASYNRAAVHLLLFGFIGAVSVGMTARLFPLFARTGLPRPRWLRVSAGFFLAGIVLMTLSAVLAIAGAATTVPEAAWRLLVGLAFFTGAYAVRAFEPRRTVPKERETEYVRATRPVTVGGSLAYGWAVLAGLMLCTQGLHQLGLPAPLAGLPGDAAIHAAGAGFMTVLILTVAPIMLPGFAGKKPILAAGHLWLLLALGNLAALLRILPYLARWLRVPSAGWELPIMAVSGLVGTLGIILLVWMLRKSWAGETG